MSRKQKALDGLKWWIIINGKGLAMKKRIDTPTVGEILSEEFMIPLGLSAYRLAEEIGVPVSRIQDILHDRRKITVDTSLRLARFFSVSDKFFLNLQNDIDIRNEKLQKSEELNRIRAIQIASA